MKPSHLVTPRTSADCTFTVGYNIAEPQQRNTHMTALVVVCVAIGVTIWILIRSLT
jgi:hypothetical protein